MGGNIVSLFGAGAVRFVSGAVPDWLAALVFGRPVARALVFSNTDTLAKKGGMLQAPSAWLKDGANIQKSGRKRYVDVMLPRARLLKREVKLPKTPRRALANAVALDMLRKTPFRTDQTYSILTDMRKEATGVSVTQWVARRDDIEGLRARLAQAGLIVRRVLVADVAAEPLADFSAAAYPMGRVWRFANIAAVLAMIAAGVWMWLHPALAVQEARIAQEAELQRLTAEALSLRQSMQAQSSEETERSAFLERMTRRTPMVATIRAATVMMPDEVWLTDMAIDRTRVTLRGSTSGSAAQMLLDLPRNRLLLDPQLAGPVSQTSDGRERFDIVFQTVQAGR